MMMNDVLLLGRSLYQHLFWLVSFIGVLELVALVDFSSMSHDRAIEVIIEIAGLN